ncbi:MAG: hypothetical protein Q8Q09_28130 [Deltaproteobacteria bacterium]|nr:hypothetical protein [Deltaproteobacteria bacterium]
MILLGLSVALLCLVLACMLAWRASVALWRAVGWVVLRRGVVVGTLVAREEPVQAPFSSRPSVWVHARVLGPPPGGGEARELWGKTLHTPAVLRCAHGTVPIVWDHVQVLTSVLWRRGTEKVIEHDSPVISRILSRSGYAKRPPSGTFFELEEAAITEGAQVLVRGVVVEGVLSRHADDAPMLVCALSWWRVVVREAWGPLLALWLAALAACAGGAVLALAWWLRRGA